MKLLSANTVKLHCGQCLIASWNVASHNPGSDTIYATVNGGVDNATVNGGFDKIAWDVASYDVYPCNCVIGGALTHEQAVTLVHEAHGKGLLCGYIDDADHARERLFEALRDRRGGRRHPDEQDLRDTHRLAAPDIHAYMATRRQLYRL